VSSNRTRKRRGAASANRARRQLRKRRERIEARLDRDNLPEGSGPVISARRVRYEVADRAVGTKAGGVGAVHTLVKRLGLDREIDASVELLKKHLPYHESDHVLNIAYSFLAGGRCLEDIEVLRQDEAFMDMLGAQRIPDPTTAGDFLRRFGGEDIEALQDAINHVRLKVWRSRKRQLGPTAIIDVDGSFTPTLGEKKQDMGFSYKGAWGYMPLLVSLANTQEPIFFENRPGNMPSHAGAAYWIDRGIELCRESGIFEEILLRGDTDFSLTENFDRWDRKGVTFILGYDAHKNVVEIADELPRSAWRRLQRPRRDVPAQDQRTRRDNVKEQIVRENEYENIRLRSEDIAEFEYQPGACKMPYRMVVVRKNLTREKGEKRLFDEIRYFFYVTNDLGLTAERIVALANQRANQENLIEQLKNGVPALRNPAHDLNSNWAYMVIASLAWSLKAWFALSQHHVADREHLLKLEFKAFLNAVMLIPAQVVRTGRRLVVKLMAYTHHAKAIISTIQAIPALRFG
jgi:hypothetical protein